MLIEQKSSVRTADSNTRQRASGVNNASNMRTTGGFDALPVLSIIALSTRNAMPRKHLQRIQLHPEHRKPRLAHLIQLQTFQRVIRLHASVKWLSKPKCSKRSLLTVIQSC